MFNFFVTYADGNWDETPYEYSLTRAITGYTEDNLRQRLSALNDDNINELINYPCLFAYETSDSNTMPARIGWINEVRKRQSSVHITYNFDPSFPPIERESIERLTWELDIQRAELYNTHWAVKNVDLLSVLVDAGIINRDSILNLPSNRQGEIQLPVTEIQTRPTVFRIPTTAIEPDLVSLMMPFDAAFRSVSTAIQQECINLGLRCQRADDIWGETELIQDIFSLIYRSKVVICDFTTRNANVFYEAGIAHTLGRMVIPITQSGNDIPADLRHHRYLTYLNNGEGLIALRTEINPRLRTLTGR